MKSLMTSSVYKMSNISSLDYQPLNSYILCTLTPCCIFWNLSDSTIKGYKPCFKPSIISAEKQFILTEDTLQYMSTLLKKKAKASSVVIQDFNDLSEKKQTSKQWVKCGVLYYIKMKTML